MVDRVTAPMKMCSQTRPSFCLLLLVRKGNSRETGRRLVTRGLRAPRSAIRAPDRRQLPRKNTVTTSNKIRCTGPPLIAYGASIAHNNEDPTSVRSICPDDGDVPSISGGSLVVRVVEDDDIVLQHIVLTRLSRRTN